MIKDVRQENHCARPEVVFRFLSGVYFVVGGVECRCSNLYTVCGRSIDELDRVLMVPTIGFLIGLLKTVGAGSQV